MSDEKIYTNSQVEQLRDKTNVQIEQLKYETNVQIEQLKNKIEKIQFKTEALRVKNVRDSSGLEYAKLKLAYHIEGSHGAFGLTRHFYPVIIDENIDGRYNNKFYVVVPTNPDRIVELTDDDTLTVQYIVAI